MGLKPGDRVEHPKWEKGIVIEDKNAGKIPGVVAVKFDNYPIRKLYIQESELKLEEK